MPHAARDIARLAGVAAAASVVLAPATPAAASCVPSEAIAHPDAARAGERVTVSSTTWFGICNDTGQKIDVTDRAVVTFVQDGQRQVVGRTASDARGHFSVVVRLPRSAQPGPATLQVRGKAASDDVPLTVTTVSTLPHTGGSSRTPVIAAVALGLAALLRPRRKVDPVLVEELHDAQEA